jgi:hypothetical protein
MKKLTTIFAAFILFFTNCKKQTNDLQNNSIDPSKTSANSGASNDSTLNPGHKIFGQASIIKLLAGQTTQAGIVSISNDKTNLYIKYITSDGWQIEKTHLYVGASDNNPAFLKENTQIGSFPYHTFHLPRTTAFTYTIPLTGLADCYNIAAQAEIVRVDDNDMVIKRENGWGQGRLIVGNNWAMVMNYCTQKNISSKINVGDYRTQTQEYWGINLQDNDPGTYLQSNFASAFPNGMLIGSIKGYKINLMSAQSVRNFLHGAGTPSPLTRSYNNPVSINNALAEQITALTLSVMFDAYDQNFCNAPNALSTLVIKSGTFQGWTVGNVLAESNQVLGGCFSVYTANQLTDVLININGNFNSAIVNKGFLSFN